MTIELVPPPANNELLVSSKDTIFQIDQKLSELHDPEYIEKLASAVRLAVAAHEGHDGLDDKPLALHCADVAPSYFRAEAAWAAS